MHYNKIKPSTILQIGDTISNKPSTDKEILKVLSDAYGWVGSLRLRECYVNSVCCKNGHQFSVWFLRHTNFAEIGCFNTEKWADRVSNKGDTIVETYMGDSSRGMDDSLRVVFIWTRWSGRYEFYGVYKNESVDSKGEATYKRVSTQYPLQEQSL